MKDEMNSRNATIGSPKEAGPALWLLNVASRVRLHALVSLSLVSSVLVLDFGVLLPPPMRFRLVPSVSPR